MGKIYFASDFHLGSPNKESSSIREKKIIQWLDSIENDADELFLVGDIFDFWFDYKRVIPKGFVRLFGKLASWRDKGKMIHFFTGNHDLWMFNYLTEELAIPIYHEPKQIERQGKTLFIAHGDGLGPGDKSYKRMKRIFNNPYAQWFFRNLHPDWGIRLASFFSGKSRESQDAKQHFLGADKEWLLQYCEYKNQIAPRDYYIFGHRHLPIDYTLKNGHSRYINLGDWLQFQSYALLDNGYLQLKFYENSTARVYP